MRGINEEGASCSICFSMTEQTNAVEAMTRQRLKFSMFTNKLHDARCFRNSPVSKGPCEIWQCWHSWTTELLWSPEIKTLLGAVGLSASKGVTWQKLWRGWLRRILKKYLSKKGAVRVAELLEGDQCSFVKSVPQFSSKRISKVPSRQIKVQED